LPSLPSVPVSPDRATDFRTPQNSRCGLSLRHPKQEDLTPIEQGVKPDSEPQASSSSHRADKYRSHEKPHIGPCVIEHLVSLKLRSQNHASLIEDRNPLRPHNAVTVGEVTQYGKLVGCRLDDCSSPDELDILDAHG